MLEYNFLVNFGCFCFASRLYMTPANARAELLVGVHAHLLRLSFIPALLVPFDEIITCAFYSPRLNPFLPGCAFGARFVISHSYLPQ